MESEDGGRGPNSNGPHFADNPKNRQPQLFAILRENRQNPARKSSHSYERFVKSRTDNDFGPKHLVSSGNLSLVLSGNEIE